MHVFEMPRKKKYDEENIYKKLSYIYMHLIFNYSHMAQNRGNVSDIRASMYEFKYINNHLPGVDKDGWVFVSPYYFLFFSIFERNLW